MNRTEKKVRGSDGPLTGAAHWTASLICTSSFCGGAFLVSPRSRLVTRIGGAGVPRQAPAPGSRKDCRVDVRGTGQAPHRPAASPARIRKGPSWGPRPREWGTAPVYPLSRGRQTKPRTGHRQCPCTASATMPGPQSPAHRRPSHIGQGGASGRPRVSGWRRPRRRLAAAGNEARRRGSRDFNRDTSRFRPSNLHYRARRNATRSCFSCEVNLSPRTRLKNSTASSSVSKRSSCR
jgi:hypothetical protein